MINWLCLSYFLLLITLVPMPLILLSLRCYHQTNKQTIHFVKQHYYNKINVPYSYQIKIYLLSPSIYLETKPLKLHHHFRDVRVKLKLKNMAAFHTVGYNSSGFCGSSGSIPVRPIRTGSSTSQRNKPIPFKSSFT
jgi:hypothetical protein